MDLTRKPLPTARLRKLVRELRDLRIAAELTIDDVANQTDVNARTLRRIENEYQRPQKRTLIALLDLYGVVGEKRMQMVALLKDGSEQGWLREFGEDLPEVYAMYMAFEAEAAAVDNYESLFVPGLLQTREYAHAVVKGTMPTASDDDIASRVEVRMRRQASLTKADPLVLATVIDEAAIRRAVGSPTIMADQLRQLAHMALPNVTLRVIPFGAGAHPGMSGSFAVMRFRDEGVPPLVYVDSLASDLLLESTAGLDRFSAVFAQLQEVALTPDDSLRLIAEAARKITKK